MPSAQVCFGSRRAETATLSLPLLAFEGQHIAEKLSITGTGRTGPSAGRRLGVRSSVGNYQFPGRGQNLARTVPINYSDQPEIPFSSGGAWTEAYSWRAYATPGGLGATLSTFIIELRRFEFVHLRGGRHHISVRQDQHGDHKAGRRRRSATGRDVDRLLPVDPLRRHDGDRVWEWRGSRPIRVSRRRPDMRVPDAPSFRR